jgi:secreted trypsin-like serine protease
MQGNTSSHGRSGIIHYTLYTLHYTIYIIHPLQIGIVKPTGKTPYCGGTIISPKHIITAAHCFSGPTQSPDSISVLIGEHVTNDDEFTRVKVAKIIVDPNYNKTSTDHDYAILELEEAIIFSKAAKPACLPTIGNTAETYEERKATVTGWGTLSSGGAIPTILQKVVVTLITKEKCEELYPGRVSPHMMCTLDVGKDSCQGDSGGPLVLTENERKALVRFSVGLN